MDERVHAEVRRIADEIGTMEIRGAAAIAEAAARALRSQATDSETTDPEAFKSELRAAARMLYETRPTAVSLPNALRYVLRGMSSTTVEGLRQDVVQSADDFCARLERAQADLGQVGANRLRDGDTIMTHCHSTDVFACVEAAVEQGKHIEAIVKETRPRLQGHITAEALHEMGVPVTLIVDSAARRYLNDVDHVLVGADAIAADGSVINKIGTSGLAVNARDRGAPIMVAAQTLKLHPGTMTGHTVDIEMRDTEEIIDDETLAELGNPTVKNPAFDVTPPRYVDAIVTERGQFPPESIVILMRELFGEGTTEPWAEP
ncbi:ribose 1,5-bisphosphate isomerase [Haloferax mediterranei ATCC 33500]|uniref:Ribose 1,5-bisphosphate isomerase n=1 Tax=Haloferax mediterranei (strain ATCC 33500 / DSM 1411 / JCM 8866 / NBRC 14739 / NCIMB 2177 / R-4) TaxID=523841 RepID=I3R372_HALMT|nr:ribose 1,5-bisphosphate isomerase [Haloferax mediterranei]AFK18682.1 ribose-1,5-bisphosphate isomerase (ribulose-bisphosphate forming) [Haloferax mediterranei ATCC 33500]EMA03457.1 translation initiation factor IF-2B subunit delta [Haloferax mediterranei ATCC 33500]MDX5988779.1 ribose 1,5-bisphosphate isomerase [Haloferax mediterranei ATCC 33500]QCQ75182.1 ribose 1,5-bisphosphate isomerase [Haloferax mediterranei ATCC 33500]